MSRRHSPPAGPVSEGPSSGNAPFAKYDEMGAYHWKMTYTGGWRRSSPIVHSRYDVALRRLSGRVDLRRAVGVDIGCGDGVMLYKIARKGGRAVGVDLEFGGLAVGREHARAAGSPEPALVCASAVSLPLADGSVGYVTGIEVIEHLPDPLAWLREVDRVLAPGGVLAVTTPHRLPAGGLHDPYHVQEWDGPGLRTLLLEVFPEVDVSLQFPPGLTRLVRGGTGLRLLDLGVRFGVKALASLGANPFELWTGPTEARGWDGLVGIARKPTARGVGA